MAAHVIPSVKSIPFLGLAILVASQLAAQPAFEVASIKRGRPDFGFSGGCHGIDSKYAPNQAVSAPPLGRCVINDARLSHMLGIAFQLHSMGLIKAGPDWVMRGDDRFNVEAKVEDPTKATEAQLLEMLQALLIERFHMKFHRETKDMPGFALEVAKNGPKLRQTQGEDVGWDYGGLGKSAPGQPMMINVRKYSMPMFASLLTQFGQPVVDKTGLAGTYDFTLSWDETNGPQLSTALQQQLGLKFESQKVPVSLIVIESAEKPTEN